MIEERIKGYINSLEPQHYTNTTEICRIGGQPMYTWDVMKAALSRKLNVFLAGETGEGKTQLEKDILGLFGNRGLFILGRNDLDVRSLFSKISGKKLQALKEGNLDSDQIKELTDKLDYHMFVVDEQTRCIPAVQNQLFNLYDGFIEIDGEVYKIGDGYCMGVSSGNIGNGKYVGTSAQDRALLDRMHVLLDMDNPNFSPNPLDFLEIASSSTDPRVKDATDLEDRTQQIIEIYNSLNKQEVPWEHLIGALYLRFGLDYLESTQHHSKRHAKNIWPNIPNLNDTEKGGDATLIYPISTRSALTYLELAKGLRAVAQAKDTPSILLGDVKEEIDETQLFLDTFRIAGAYSGILNQDRINRDPNYEGNLYTALGAINQGIKTEFDAKMEKLFDAFVLAQQGKIDGTLLREFEGKWQFMQPIIKHTAKSNKPVEETRFGVFRM